MTTIIKMKCKTRKHIHKKCMEHMLMTGAAHALIIIIIHTTFPFLSLSPGPDLHLPTSGQKQPPNSSPGLCLLHDYEVKLYFAELVLLFKNLIDHNIMFRFSSLADGAACNCFCRLCCEFCPLYTLIDLSPRDCPHFRHQSQV